MNCQGNTAPAFARHYCRAVLALMLYGFGVCDVSAQFANMPLPPGLSLFYRPFLGTNNVVGDLAADPSQLRNGYSVFMLDRSGFRAVNYLNGWSEPEIPLHPGDGWFMKNPYPVAESLIGGGVWPYLSGCNVLPAGLCACGSTLPQPGSLTTDLAFPAANHDMVYLFDNVQNTYSAYTFDSSQGWLPSEPYLQYFQAFWLRKATQAVWCQISGSYPTNVVEATLSGVPKLNFLTFNATNSSLGQVFDTNRITPLSSGFKAQIYAGANSNSVDFLRLGEPASFLDGDGAGYIRSGAAEVPFASAGDAIYVQLRAWKASDGSTFEIASTNGAVGKSSVMHLIAHAAVENGQPGLPPLDVNGFSSFALSLPPASPSLLIRRTKFSITISWPSPSTGFGLQDKTALDGGTWKDCSQTPDDDGTTKSVTLPIGTGNSFYRLNK